MRSPAEMDIVQIDISTKCHLACSNCTRLIPHQTQRSDMPVETFERAVRSMEGWNAPNKLIGVIAGEPTLHGNFERISRRFAELWGGENTNNAKFPIKDFNDFATQRLFDRSNGRGLWTSLGNGFYRHYETIMEVYSHFNTNTHETAGQHQALLITRKDYTGATGMSDAEWEYNRDNCWVQKLWSATINDKGAYFCEVAGAIDRLYFDGKHAWPVEHGWWQRTPSDFKDQLELCNYCALAQPGPSQLDLLDRDIISAEHKQILKKLGSPAIRKRAYEMFDPELHMQKRQVETRDNYVGDASSGRRVGIGHNSTKPRKVVCVMTSVGYGDDLALTLPPNMREFDEVIVVTTNDDTRTQEVVAANGATLVISDRCFEDDHAFNKGKMLNDGLKGLKDADWIVFTDADIIMHEGFYEIFMSYSWNPGCLYFTTRIDSQKVEGKISETTNSQPNGYFQLFNAKALAIRDNWPNIVNENFCSAGSVDSWFYQQWRDDQLIGITDIPVQHIASERLGENWNGKQAKPKKWRQFGILTINGITPLMPATEVPETVRLTDTRYGETLTVHRDEIPNHVQYSPTGGLIFKGKDIGRMHIHVAYWAD
jgi:glycosyltransferase involved in cell wall biosynthesis